jgi:hypothetical protein
LIDRGDAITFDHHGHIELELANSHIDDGYMIVHQGFVPGSSRCRSCEQRHRDGERG